MINIKTFLFYSKIIGIFITLELCVSFLMGFFNLIGVSSFLTNTFLLIFNIILFSVYGYKAGKKTNKKGFIEGLITGSIFIVILLLLSLIIFHKSLTLSTLFYYLSLITISMVSSIIGRNKKEDITQKG